MKINTDNSTAVTQPSAINPTSALDNLWSLESPSDKPLEEASENVKITFNDDAYPLQRCFKIKQ